MALLSQVWMCGVVVEAKGMQEVANDGESKTNLVPFFRAILTVNEFRTARVAEVLSDFQSLQYYIAASPVNPPNMDDYYTEGWTALRQCNIDGQRILNCGADTSVPETSGGPEEQAKAELKQSVYSRTRTHHTHITSPDLPTPPSPGPHNPNLVVCGSRRAQRDEERRGATKRGNNLGFV